MKSKAMIRRFIQPALDAGKTQKELCQQLGIRSANYITQLRSDNYPTELLSPDRFEQFARVFEVGDEDLLRLALARLDDADGNKIELSKSTFIYLLKVTDRVRVARRAATLSAVAA